MLILAKTNAINRVVTILFYFVKTNTGFLQPLMGYVHIVSGMYG